MIDFNLHNHENKATPPKKTHKHKKKIGLSDNPHIIHTSHKQKNKTKHKKKKYENKKKNWFN